MLSKVARAGVFYAGIIAFWQALALTETWPSYVFPSPVSVFESLIAYVANGLVLDAIQISLTRLAVGYVISFFLGMTIGILSGTIKWLDETVGNLVAAIQSLPSITWLPLAVLWFGLTEKAIIFVVLMGSIFAVAISARDGVRSIPPLLVRAGQTFGASRWQMYRYVMVPGMLPSMVQGLKLGWSFAWRSLAAGELLFVSLGLGHLLNLGRELNDMSLVIAIMLVIIAVGLTIDRVLFARLESWVRQRWGFTSA
jgi:NitT/TauT family transport system permease protein